MSDRQVSVEGKTYPLDPPFIVLATQNPYEFEGTYVLPESQLDRFMIRLRMGYPTRSEERRLLVNHRDGEPVESLSSVLTADDVVRLQQGVRPIRVDEAIAEYLLDIVHMSRRSEDLHVGVGTARGTDALPRSSEHGPGFGTRFRRSRRYQDAGRADPAHRVLGKSFLQAGEFGAAESIIRDIVERMRVPV